MAMKQSQLKWKGQEERENDGASTERKHWRKGEEMERQKKGEDG
jgi:hypothetical protein